MARASKNDPRLARVTRLCLALPETTDERSGSHSTFRVRKKTFAYFLDDHHGDGVVAIACKTEPGVNHSLAAEDPHKYYLPAYIGPRGWVALRLDLGPIDWDEVEELIRGSYRRTAPPRLGSTVAPPAD